MGEKAPYPAPCSRGVIDVPADATGIGRSLHAVMSDFGGYFVTARVENDDGSPGEEGLTEEHATWLDGVCEATGRIFVPVDLLREPYEGPSVLSAAGDGAGRDARGRR
ncbi:hypothetical protein OHT52_24450 [Streptomyces sp. NBC_00247]|uniref:hypothetical protein n=1 Tax=Streptomyces sp. NBC_00247 TaxID=2975689 RepID=UPI002E29BD01|nr:hypothetical protein [Streptomyces sp. NBC_00247]